MKLSERIYSVQGKLSDINCCITSGDPVLHIIRSEEWRSLYKELIFLLDKLSKYTED